MGGLTKATLIRVILFSILTFTSIFQAKAVIHYVDIYPSGFYPNQLQIAPGDTVLWINQDEASHTVTSANNLWTRGYLIDYQDVWGHTFSQAGAYSYYCEFDGFTGTVSVGSTSSGPANDQCGGAIAMTPHTLYTNNTATATSTGDPAPSCANLGKGVWYTFTPQSSGAVSIQTCGSDFDTVLAVYTGSCGSLSMLSNACNDDSGTVCYGTNASLTFSATAGTTYRILAGGKNGASGNLKIKAIPAPANDSCSGAIPLFGWINYTVDTSGATSANEPASSCSLPFGKGTWYKFKPYATGLVNINTCGSDFQTVTVIYTNTCGSLSPVPAFCSNYNVPCGFANPGTTFNAIANTEYHVLIGGLDGASGTLKIRIEGAFPGWAENQVPFDIGMSLARSDTNLVHVVNNSNFHLLTLNTDTGSFISSVQLDGPASPSGVMGISPDNQFLYVPLQNKKVQVIALATLTTLDIVPLTILPKSLAAASDGMLYAVDIFDDIFKINPASGDTLGLVSDSFSKPILKVNSSGTRLYAMEVGLTGTGWKVGEFQVVAGALPLFITNHFQGLSNDTDFVIAEDINTLYVTGDGLNGVAKWDMTTRTYESWPYGSLYGAGVAMAPNSSHVYGASADPNVPRIRCFNRDTGMVLATFDIYSSGRPQGAVLDRSLKVTPNGRVFYAREGRRVGLIGASSFQTNLPTAIEYVFAGTNRTVVAGEIFNLSATGPLISGAIISWNKISGPGQVTFHAPASANTTAQVASAGTYVVEVVRTNGPRVSRDRLSITALPRPIRMDQMDLLNDGKFQMRLNSEPGWSLIVEASSNLVHWTTITNVSNAGGTVTITDSAPTQTRRFYRTRQAN